MWGKRRKGETNEIHFPTVKLLTRATDSLLMYFPLLNYITKQSKKKREMGKKEEEKTEERERETKKQNKQTINERQRNNLR